MFKTPFNWFNKFGTLPESYTEAMSYEEQIMWLCKEVKDNEDFIDEFREEFGKVDEVLTNLQEQINGNHRDILDLQTNKQDKLTAGFNIQIRKFEEGTSEEETEIDTEPIIQDSLIIGGSYIQLGDKEVTDFIDLTPIELANTAYIIVYAKAGESYEFNGHFDLATFNNNNLEITAINKNKFSEDFFDYIECDIDTNFVVSFYQTDTYVPEVRSYINNTYIYDKLNSKQDKLIAGNGITIQNNVISADSGLEPINLTELITTGAYIDLSGSLGDTVDLTPVSASNTAYYIKEITPVTKFTIVGNVTVAEIDAENVIVNKSTGTGTASNPLIYDSIAFLPSNARIIFSFTGTDSISPSIKYDIDSISINNSFADMKAIHKFREDLYLDDSSPDTGLIDGLYFTDKYHVYINNTISYQFDNALILVNGSRLCVIASPSNNTNHLMYYQVYYNNSQWNYGFMHASTTWSEVSGKPSINNLSDNLYLVDGTSTTGLEDGLYYTSTYHIYVNNALYNQFDEALILIDGSSVYVVASPNIAHSHNMYYQVNYTNGEWIFGIMHPYTEWSLISDAPTNNSSIDLTYFGLSNKEHSGLYFGTGTDVRARYEVTPSTYNDVYLETSTNKVTSISSSSTNTEYPSAKATYDAIPKITYSTTDLTAGTSPLDTGTFYFVYE